MINENSTGKRPLSKFSNADSADYTDSPFPRRESGNAGISREKGDPPLSNLLEQAFRGGGTNFGLGQSFDEERGPVTRLELHSGEQVLPQKLIEELTIAHEQVWSSDGPVAGSGQDVPLNPILKLLNEDGEARPQGRLARLKAVAQGGARKTLRGAAVLKVVSAKAGRWLIRSLRRVASSLRFVHWHRRYFMLTSWVHRAIFDRRLEKLLFIPTVHAGDKEAEPRPIHFVYQGPLPSRVFNWALSTLPADVKHYAFVDLNAGNGRTLLLAARRNFEYAIGYSFGAERTEELELNVAQYPRSYMSCRDVRVIRGDKEGVEFPPQPCVLFIPDKIRGSTLGTVLGYIAASWRMNRRPIYLIFENVSEGIMPLYQDIFEKRNPPLLNRIKLALFSPARVAIYRSVEDAPPGGDVA